MTTTGIGGGIGTWTARHRRSIAFIFVLLICAGVVSGLRLPVALFPHVDFPRVVVSIDSGDRPAERMAIEITRPVEESLRGIPGVTRVRSSTSRGSAEISTNFEWGHDMAEALLMVDSAINRQASSLPAGTRFEVRRMDPTVFPVLAYSLTSDTLSPTELYDIAYYQLRPEIATVPGVGHASVLGGREQEYRVTVDLGRLQMYGLTVTDVADAISQSDVLTAVGRVEDLHKLYLVVARATSPDLEAIGNIILKRSADGAVLVEDVAVLSNDVKPAWTRVTADGHDAVLLQVYQQPSGNTVQVATAVKGVIDRHRATLPKDLRLRPWYDQSELIQASAASVRDAVLIGVLLAGLVLLVFLRSIRIALIALLTVPGVLAATSLLLVLAGMSFNIMTLGGMAAAVGLIIDDTIVMVEHIEATREAEGGTLRAAAALTRPLVVSSSVTVIVFTPLAFLSGVTGAFFKALSLTMAASLVISFFVAWLVVPLLFERLLAKRPPHDTSPRGWVRAYRALLGGLLRRPWLAVLLVAPLLLSGWYGYRSLGSGFMPSMDEGGFILDYRAPSGTSLADTDALCRKVESILQATPEVETYSRRTGLALGGGLTEANEGDYFIRLTQQRSRGVEQIMDDVRTRVTREVPGLEIEMAQLMEDLIGDLSAVPQPIEIELFSDDPKVLGDASDQVTNAISKIPGVVDVAPGIVLAGDALDVHVDPVRAAIEGMTPASVTEAVRANLDGTVAAQVQHDPKLIGVRVWVPRELRSTTHDVERMQITAPDGHVFRLGRVATVRVNSGQPQITRDDLRRMVAVTGRISGRDMGSVMNDVRAALRQDGVVPKDVTVRYGGLYAEQQAAFTGLVAVFLAAVALVFLLLLYVYESFRVALVMMLTTLTSLCAVLLALWLTGTPLNISSMMGMTMVVGIVTEVAVFYTSQLVLVRKDDEAEALLQAGVERARPIAMTTLAAILALLPLALAIGEGASMEQPLAIAIIGGLAAQMPLVLLMLPALLLLVRAKPTT